MILAGAAFMAWLCYLSSDFLRQTPPELIGVLVFLFFVGFFLWAVIGFWTYFADITIFADRLEIRNFGRRYHKIIYFTDIIDVKIVQKHGEHESWKELTVVFGDNKKYKIYSNCYDNYGEMATFLKRKQKVKSNKKIDEADQSNRISKIIFYVSLFLCVFGLVYFYKQSQDFKVITNDLVSIEFTLNSKPSIKTGSKSSEYLALDIKEHPDFSFDISGVVYDATQISNLIANTGGGDRITLTIDKEDYLQKLVQSKALTFWKKYFGFRKISIYGIKDEKQIYLSIADYETENRVTSTHGAISMLVLLLIIAYIAWAERKHEKGNKNK
jgi:hypothetical protein